jgi:hypothetical protein
MAWRVGGLKTACYELALDCCAISLSGAATKVLQEKPRHIQDYNFFVLRLTRSISQPLLVAAASQ